MDSRMERDKVIAHTLVIDDGVGVYEETMSLPRNGLEQRRATTIISI